MNNKLQTIIILVVGISLGVGVMSYMQTNTQPLIHKSENLLTEEKVVKETPKIEKKQEVSKKPEEDLSRYHVTTFKVKDLKRYRELAPRLQE